MYLVSSNTRNVVSPRKGKRFRGQIFFEERTFKDPAAITGPRVRQNTQIKRLGVTYHVYHSMLCTA